MAANSIASTKAAERGQAPGEQAPSSDARKAAREPPRPLPASEFERERAKAGAMASRFARRSVRNASACTPSENPAPSNA